jgi:hypothetical protein
MMKNSRRIVSGFLVVVVLAGLTTSARASGGDFLASPKFHGALLMGLGSFLIVEAFDSKSQANKAYDDYASAGQVASVRQFYDESKRHDTRAAVYGVLGVGAIVYSIHLFTKGDDNLPSQKMEEGLVTVKGISLDVDGNFLQKKMGLALRRGF